MRARLFVAFVCLFAAGGALGHGQAQDAQSSPPVFRSSVEAVQVSVIVTDADGNPVAGLTEADFELFEGDSPQPITTFSAVDIPLPQEDQRPRIASDVLSNDGPPGRLYLIALDEVSPEHAVRARHFLRGFIERHFGPQDVAAVVLLGRGLSTDGQEFTSNPALLLQAIDKYGGGFAAEGGGIDTLSARVRFKDLRALLESIAKIDGRRKAMIYVSSSPPGDAYDLVDYVPGPLGGMFASVDPDFQHAISAATRGNIAIYTVDPQGLTTELTEAGSFNTAAMEARGALDSLAEVTGGFSLSNSNNFAGAFDRLVREHSTYYLLGFNSSYDRRDGRYIRIDVRVRRPGLQVRTIDGYIAPRGSPPRRPEPTDALLPAVLEAVSSPVTMSGVPLRVFAAPYRDIRDSKNATVAISLEIDASRLNLVEQDGVYRGELEIVFAVTDAKKTRRPLMRHRAALALKPETYARVMRSGLRVLSQLALPEGRYQVRASAGGSALAGSVVYDVTVPDFKDDLAMSGVTVVSAHSRDALTVMPHTQIDAPLPGTPTTAREFTRDDTLTFFAEIYENRRKPHVVTLTTELRDADGTVINALTMQRETTEKRAGRYGFTPHLLLEDLAAGSYTVRMEARSSLDRSRSVVREVGFRVR